MLGVLKRWAFNLREEVHEEAFDWQWCLCRLKWKSGNPFAKIFDAAPTSVNASQFLRVDGHNLVIGCKRY